MTSKALGSQRPGPSDGFVKEPEGIPSLLGSRDLGFTRRPAAIGEIRPSSRDQGIREAWSTMLND